MNRREFLHLTAAGAGTLAAGSFAQPAPGQPRPNLILCMADDQGWGDMGYNGHPVLRTPNFDAMAREGLRFDRFYAAAPVCSPTRGSVMTGRHPNRFGCFTWGHPLRPQEITVAAALRQAGYATGHFGKWHLGSVQAGSPVNPGACGFDTWVSAPNFFDNDPILSRGGKAVQMQGESSMVTMELALEFIRAQSARQQPFLAVIWFGSPHAPHRAAPEDRALYPNETPAMQNFLGEVTGMDRAMGKLRAALRELGIRDNTLLWYCSDNGGLPKVGATGGRGNKGQVYEGGLRVPAILEWPARWPTPRTCAIPCTTSDIFPTVLQAAGVAIPHGRPLDGIGLLPLLAGNVAARPGGIGFWSFPAKGIPTPSHEWMTELLQAQRDGTEDAADPRLLLKAGDLTTQYAEDDFPGHAAWLEWPWKLHRVQRPDRTVKQELYNLADDPAETTDRAGADNAPLLAAMDARLNQWLASVVRSLNGKDY